MKAPEFPEDSALNVNPGIDQPPSLDPGSVKRFIRKKKPPLDAAKLSEAILAGNRTLLSRAITLVESSKPEHQKVAQEIITRCLPHSGNSVRIGITGVPGVGKSSFIEAIGSHLTGMGHKLAVLAIDPSSEKSGGSILGDKTRMESLSNDPSAFIRPSPSAGSLGGVARKTRETMILCEAAGFDVIFIETVGVGQSETAVHSMVDFFLLLMLAGAGDELQGIKRGIMEMADLIAITKADGENQQAANRAVVEYRNALHLLPPAESRWIPEVTCISAREKRGLPELWTRIGDYFSLTKENGYFHQNRRNQSKLWMNQTVQEQLLSHFYRHPSMVHQIRKTENLVQLGKLSSFQAAAQLLDLYFSKFHPGIDPGKEVGGNPVDPL
jgi:LAO/AO transport system kinase